LIHNNTKQSHQYANIHLNFCKICCQESVKSLNSKIFMVQHQNKLQNCLVFYDLMFWYPHWLQFSFDSD